MHSIPSYNRINISCSIDNTPNLPEWMHSYHNHMQNLAGAREEKQTFHGYDTYPNHAICGTAALTPLGAAQHIKNGKLFKDRYTHALKISAKNMYESVLVRSTDWPRCFESALAFMYGFLSEFSVSKLDVEMAKDNRMCLESKERESLPCHCEAIERDLDAQAATFLEGDDDVTRIQSRNKVSSRVAEVTV